MRILQLCNRVPFPPRDGGAIAMLNMVQAFYELRQDLALLCINTRKHNVPRSTLPPLFDNLAAFEMVNVDTDITAKAALYNLLFSRESYNISRFFSERFDDMLIGWLKKVDFDVIHIEGLHMTIYLDTLRRHAKGTPVVLRAHNLEYLIWERLAQAERNPAKRAYLSVLARRLKKYELGVMNRVDGLVPITGQDADTFRALGCTKPMHVCPTGVELAGYPMQPEAAEWPSCFHLGALDWMPNQQGVQWFLDEVWPKVHARHPQMKFYLAGRHMPERFRNLQRPGVVVVGEVESAVDFMNSKSLMVAPLLAGSGMRIKILEGMALGKTIISTTIGAEGIHVEDGKEILLADTPDAFAEAISRCIQDRPFAQSIGTAARQRVEEEYTNTKLVAQLLGFYRELRYGPVSSTGEEDVVF